jgi:hypothetical protein
VVLLVAVDDSVRARTLAEQLAGGAVSDARGVKVSRGRSLAREREEHVEETRPRGTA